QRAHGRESHRWLPGAGRESRRARPDPSARAIRFSATPAGRRENRTDTARRAWRSRNKGRCSPPARPNWPPEDKAALARLAYRFLVWSISLWIWAAPSALRMPIIQNRGVNFQNQELEFREWTLHLWDCHAIRGLNAKGSRA